ncbi:MAG: FAD:protein FMN transferase [Clostridium sp.]|nr:FAD:protein FMN transferase [Prevotella sp.]MCM1429459.1 FAD:protein FMN transferase [Clostridium sp.]MCM1475506.1 FAD:protein FMN transferase [Muribaculaceae bacterium]
MKPKHIYKLWCATVVIVASIVGYSCSPGQTTGKYVSADGMVWNTTYHIVWNGDEALRDSILQVLDGVGSSLNVFDETSLVSRVNRSKEPIAIDAHFKNVYNMSKRVAQESDGAFDPTLSPLITAWGFGPGHKATADTLRLDSLLAMTGISRTHLDGRMLYKENPKIVFNFSALAKGYGCDRVGAMFQRNGVEDYMIEIGGEVVCTGKNPEGTDWHIQIDKPIISRGVVHESMAVIGLSGKGLATSGNYRNRQGNAGSTYGHTISAKTGRPVQTDVLSVSVVGPNAMEADALATACMATGSEKGMQMCAAMNCPVMMILTDTVIMSESFRRLVIQQP